MADKKQIQVSAPSFIFKAENAPNMVTRVGEFITGERSRDTASIIRFQMGNEADQWPWAQMSVGFHLNYLHMVQPVTRAATVDAIDRFNYQFSTARSPLVKIAIGMEDYESRRLVFMGRVVRCGASGQMGNQLMGNIELQHQYADLNYMDLAFLGQMNNGYFINTTRNVVSELKQNAAKPDMYPGAAQWEGTFKGATEKDKHTSLAALVWAALEAKFYYARNLWLGGDGTTGPGGTKTTEEKIRAAWKGVIEDFLNHQYPLLRNILEKSVNGTRAKWVTDMSEPFMNGFLQSIQAEANPWGFIRNFFRDYGYSLVCPSLWFNGAPDDILVPHFILDDVFKSRAKPIVLDSDSDVYSTSPHGGIPVRQVVAQRYNTQSDYFIHHDSGLRNRLSVSPSGEDALDRYLDMREITLASGGEMIPGVAAWPVYDNQIPDIAYDVNSQIMVVTIPEMWDMTLLSGAPVLTLTECTVENKAVILEQIDQILDKIKDESFDVANRLRETAIAIRDILQTEEPLILYNKETSAFTNARTMYIRYQETQRLRLFAFLTYVRHVLRQYSAGPFLCEFHANSFIPETGYRYKVMNGSNHENERIKQLFSGVLSSMSYTLDMSQASAIFTATMTFNHVLVNGPLSDDTASIRGLLERMPDMQTVFETGEVPIDLLGPAETPWASDDNTRTGIYQIPLDPPAAV